MLLDHAHLTWKMSRKVKKNYILYLDHFVVLAFFYKNRSELVEAGWFIAIEEWH